MQTYQTKALESAVNKGNTIKYGINKPSIGLLWVFAGVALRMFRVIYKK